MLMLETFSTINSLKEKATLYAKESLSHVRVCEDNEDDEDKDDE